MPDKIVIKRRAEPNPGPQPPGSKGPSTAVLVLGALCAVVGLSGWLYVRARLAADRAAMEQRAASEEVKLAEAAVARAKAEAAERLAARHAEPTGREQVVDDPDGQLLWASPTAGEPISLSFLPSGTQCLLHFRPALFASHPESEKVLASLGPWGEAALAAFQKLTHSRLQEIDHATIAVIVDDDARVDVSIVSVMAPGVWDDARLAERWPDAQAQQHGEQNYYVADDRAYYLVKPAHKSSIVVACPTRLVEELIDAEDEPPMLPRDLESLHATSDAARMATIIASPHFFDAAGSDILTGDAAPLRDALAALVDDRAAAIAISAHWNENFFIEIRAAPALNVPPRSLAATLEQRVYELPDAIDDLILAQAWPAYGRKMLARFPGMLRQLADNTRRGDADKQALLRAYLPAVAGHNLLMGAELLLTQRNMGDANNAESAAPQELTLNERLERPVTLSFTKDTLQRALELLAEEIEAEIKIEGNELRVDGITQNQTLAIDLHDRPAREILTEILRRANPDRTAENAADPRQKLVYVVEEGDGGQSRMIVTTRAAALRRGLALPAEFADPAE